MGYMGLNHWEESDNAADFVFLFEKAKTKAQRHKVIDKELEEFGNSYNTPGSVNIALAIEDGKVGLDDLKPKHLERMQELLGELKNTSSAKYKEEWGSESNRLEHYEAYKRLLKVIKV